MYIERVESSRLFLSIPPEFTIAAEGDLVVFFLNMDPPHLFNQWAIPQFFKRRFIQVANLQFPVRIHATGYDISIPCNV